MGVVGDMVIVSDISGSLIFTNVSLGCFGAVVRIGFGDVQFDYYRQLEQILQTGDGWDMEDAHLEWLSMRCMGIASRGACWNEGVSDKFCVSGLRCSF